MLLLDGVPASIPASEGPQVLDAIVVLGCRVAPGALGGAAGRRARRAAEAWASTAKAWVIASGGRRWDGLSEADAFAGELARCGVAPARILRELCSLSTTENAFYSAGLLHELGTARVGLVTCDFHMPRAVACFRAVGLDPIAMPVESPRRSWSRRVSLGVRERASAWLEAWVGACDDS